MHFVTETQPTLLAKHNSALQPFSIVSVGKDVVESYRTLSIEQFLFDISRRHGLQLLDLDLHGYMSKMSNIDDVWPFLREVIHKLLTRVSNKFTAFALYESVCATLLSRCKNTDLLGMLCTFDPDTKTTGIMEISRRSAPETTSGSAPTPLPTQTTTAFLKILTSICEAHNMSLYKALHLYMMISSRDTEHGYKKVASLVQQVETGTMTWSLCYDIIKVCTDKGLFAIDDNRVRNGLNL